MNNLKQKFSELLGQVVKKPKLLRDPQLMHPEREWLLGLGVGLALFVLAASYSVYIYMVNRAVAVAVSIEDESAGVYRESTVKEVLTEIENRKATHASLTERGIVVEEIILPEPQASTTEEEVVVEEEILVE